VHLINHVGIETTWSCGTGYRSHLSKANSAIKPKNIPGARLWAENWQHEVLGLGNPGLELELS
jgi:hypothetical protein